MNEENENKEENKIEIERPIVDEKKIEIEQPKIENEIKIEDNTQGAKLDDLQVEMPGEERIIMEVTNENGQKQEDEKIIFKGNRPKKLLNKSKRKIEIEEPKIEEGKLEETKKEEIIENLVKDYIKSKGGSIETDDLQNITDSFKIDNKYLSNNKSKGKKNKCCK